MSGLPHRTALQMSARGRIRALAGVSIALVSVLLAPPAASAARPFNGVEETAVQVALEHWGTAPTCLGGFGRAVVTNEEIDDSPAGRRYPLRGHAYWSSRPARDCKIVLAQRSKAQGYAAFCTTVTHEVGHLIRLDDWHSDDPADVMYSHPEAVTPHCRARERWMLSESDRLDAVANALRRRCQRLHRTARIGRYRRCRQRMNATRMRADALMVAVNEVR